MSSSTFETAARRAARSGTPIEIRLRASKNKVEGLLLAASPELFVVRPFNDGAMVFEGFELLPRSEVKALRRLTDFRVPTIRVGRTLRAPRFPLTNIEDFLHWALGRERLVGFAREYKRPNAMRVGRVSAVTSEFVTLKEVDTHARWEPRARKARLSEVTNISFHTPYLNTLERTVFRRKRIN